MKKTIIAALLCAIAGNVHAQNTYPWSNSGSVGIGTLSPATSLEVTGTTEQFRLGYDATHYTSFTTAATGGLTIRTPICSTFINTYAPLAGTNIGLAIDVYHGVKIARGTGVHNEALLDVFTNDPLTTGANLFRIRNSATDFFTVGSAGQVGFGTVAPASILSNTNILPTDNNSFGVNPSGISWKVTSGGNDQYAMSLENYGSYGNGLLIKNNSAGHRSLNIVDASNTVQFYVGDGRIYSGGDLQSAGKFVMGSDLAALPIGNAESMISTYHGLLLVGQRGASFSGPISTIGDPANVAVPVQDPAKLGFLVRGASSQTADLFQVQNSALTKLLNVSASGNVGIGTTDNASWQLATSLYKLAVGGNIIGEEMVVKVQANWPDYIFKKNYPLMPLNELKSYIDKNQHLPEIPSAAQIEKDGLNLGEMNKLLVKKVEELTLYMLEKDKQVKAQQERLDALAKQLEALSKKVNQ